MAGATLLRGIMVLLGRVAGQTEGACRGQLGNRAFRVAGIAAPVGVNRPLVSRHNGRGTVARRALPRLSMVLLVAARARPYGVDRCQADRRHVTVGAGQSVVLLVLELNGAAPPILLGHRDGDLDWHRRGE